MVPKLIHEANLDALCEHVDILKVEVLEEQLSRRSESLAGVRPTLQRILADIHERLTFCARTHVHDQDGKALPSGPVVISPDGLFPSLYREGVLHCPVVCLILTIGNSAIILVLWPIHAFWTYYSIARTKQFGPCLKLLICIALPVLLVLWILIGILGSVVAGAGFGFFVLMLATFEAVGEGKTDDFIHCFVEYNPAGDVEANKAVDLPAKVARAMVVGIAMVDVISANIMLSVYDT